MAVATQTVRSSLPTLFFTDALPRPYPTVLNYAIAGMGKTNCIRTLTDDFKPLVIATEAGNSKGMSTLADLRLPVFLLNTIEEIIAVTTELNAQAKPGELYYNGQGPFTALAVDSLTGIGKFLEDKSRQQHKVDTIWGGELKDPRQAYPYIAEKGRQVVDKLMALPVPLLLLCREGLMSEGEGAATVQYAAPELPGQKLPRELPGWPEATVRMRMVNGHRVCVTENEGYVIARVRLPQGKRLPKFIRPHMGALIKVLINPDDQDAYKRLELTSTSSPLTPQQQQAAAARQAAAASASTVQTPQK
jgi:hypothetical protein